MDSLEQIRLSLNNNPNIQNDIKERLFYLVTILNKKLPDINLDRLNENLKSVSFGKLGKFERKGTYFYDVLKNKIFFSSNLAGNYDIDHLLMKAMLQMATSTGKFTGFNSDERLMALNLAYTEILANYIIGNEGDSDLEEEVLVANLLSHIVGKDTMYNSYFKNDGSQIIKAMQDSEVGLL